MPRSGAPSSRASRRVDCRPTTCSSGSRPSPRRSGSRRRIASGPGRGWPIRPPRTERSCSSASSGCCSPSAGSLRRAPGRSRTHTPHRAGGPPPRRPHDPSSREECRAQATERARGEEPHAGARGLRRSGPPRVRRRRALQEAQGADGAGRGGLAELFRLNRAPRGGGPPPGRARRGDRRDARHRRAEGWHAGHQVRPPRVRGHGRAQGGLHGEEQRVIALESVSKGYGGQELLRDCSWRVVRGERIGLVGPNGAGKTTLCRIMAGVEEPDAGRVHRDGGISVGYLPQEVGGGGGARTVLAEALSGFDEGWQLGAALEALALAMARPGADPALTDRYGEIQHRFEALGGYRLEAQAKVILGGLGFEPASVHRPLGEISGGWRLRAALARLLLLRPDLLLLDEPTNHLDLESLEWLEGFLASYDGSVVIVSPHRYFLNRMVTSI